MYHIFSWYMHAYPKGGMQDYTTSVKNLEEASEYIERELDREFWWQVVNSDMSVVLERLDD